MAGTQTNEKSQSWGLGWKLFLLGMVVAGVVLRLIWVQDIEFKADEKWTFVRTQSVGRTESLPWLGMPTSYSLPHPGGTVWVFVGLARLFDVTEPTGLARAVQLLNILAIVMLLAFALRVVPVGQREPWLWAVALMCVNPLAVLLQRKIWPPSAMPAFVILMIACWWYRDRRLGAFAWGLVGSLVGFLYPAAMFLAAGFTLWALVFDRRGVRWRQWLVGSLLGVLPLLPWFCHVWEEMGTNPISQRRWTHLVEFKFWMRWVTEPFGISLEYAFGKDFPDFLSYPHVAGRATYVVGALHVLLLAAAALTAGRLAKSLWSQRGQLHRLVSGTGSQTALTLSACMWGFGLVFTATLLPIHRHYMIITFPFMFLWVARAALSSGPRTQAPTTAGRALLLSLCSIQMLISISMLGYIHVNQRAIQGDYGVPYGAQHAAR